MPMWTRARYAARSLTKTPSGRIDVELDVVLDMLAVALEFSPESESAAGDRVPIPGWRWRPLENGSI